MIIWKNDKRDLKLKVGNVKITVFITVRKHLRGVACKRSNQACPNNNHPQHNPEKDQLAKPLLFELFNNFCTFWLWAQPKSLSNHEHYWSLSRFQTFSVCGPKHFAIFSFWIPLVLLIDSWWLWFILETYRPNVTFTMTDQPLSIEKILFTPRPFMADPAGWKQIHIKILRIKYNFHNFHKNNIDLTTCCRWKNWVFNYSYFL